MNTLEEYQLLAALITATRGIDSRRLQRLVFVLEALGAPFRYKYRMYFDEPYSEDLEADVNLLTSQGFVTQEEDPKRDAVFIRPSGAASVYLDLADELKPYLPTIDELTRVDAHLLNFATTFGAWRRFKYGTSDALEQAFKSTGTRKIDTEGEDFLRRLGLLARS